MILSWNEIKERAIRFSREWAGASREQADAKPFLVEFFNIFGISSKRVSSFEYRVKRLGQSDGYIDLLWKGMILVEMKSRGKSLDEAHTQAKDYLHGLKEHELPKYIMLCNFEYFRLHDLEDGNTISFQLKDLVGHVQHFGYLLGYQRKVYQDQDPANIKAAEMMGKLHDRLEEIGYTGHSLEVYLVRMLFCLFAEDTTIFNKFQFQEYIEQRTNPDGSDLAAKMQELFQVLNTPSEKRFKTLDEHLMAFPYVNGHLFEEMLPIASFDSKMREAVLQCCYIDWSKISPAIFGSMFQSVMDPQERRNLGAHYTSEQNILKVIKPLFLDGMWEEFERIRGSKQKLGAFHKKLGSLRFLDPACGCGNFLVITYRELRLLEIEVLRALNAGGQGFLDVREIISVDIDQFYGIEYEEFPARIAEVAMWLVDHQMNMRVSQEFGQYFVRLPLNKAATIVHGDALAINWQSLLNRENTLTVYANHANIITKEPDMPYGTVNVFANTYTEKTKEQLEQDAQGEEARFDYIIGNPPFIGSKVMSQHQRDQIVAQFGHTEGTGVLDYVTGWYMKAAKYIQGTQIKVAFVSTNSIVQGEQVSLLWEPMMKKYGVKIHFAHRTFKWSNEARGNAAVYCVIIGFASYDTPQKLIFDYEDIMGEAHEIRAKHINGYLLDARDIFISKRTNPICQVPKMSFGNMPLDGGHLLLSDEEKEAFVLDEPNAEKYLMPLISAHEFLNGKKRWCLWLVNADPGELRRMPQVMKRIEAVKKFRLASPAPSTQKFAAIPTLFRDRNRPETYILVPSTTSENRDYIPMGFFHGDSIANNSCHIIPNGNKYHFGVLMSKMHVSWVKVVCGRLKSDLRYSKDIVYNNFPWPENPTAKAVANIEEAVKAIMAVRESFPESSLADLYDPSAMPPALVHAHANLDRAVDLAYRPQAFSSDIGRTEFLFDLYQKYTADLFTLLKKKRK